MLVIRFARRGRKKAPFYDIVVAEKSRPVKKKFITKLGYFNPLANGGAGELVYDKDMTVKYIGNGAQLSQAAARLLAKDGLKQAEKFIEKRVTKPKKEEPKPEPVEEVAEETPAEEAPAEETAETPEEAPTEEPKAEEAPAAEEAPTEEAPAEAAPAEEAKSE